MPPSYHAAKWTRCPQEWKNVAQRERRGIWIRGKHQEKWPSGWEQILQEPEPSWRAGADSHQDIQAGSLEEGDLVGDGEGGETGKLLGEFHSLNDALGGEFTELVPEVNVQGDTLF